MSNEPRFLVVDGYTKPARDELAAAGHVLASDTDTEVVVHLITLGLERGDTPAEATKAALARLEGAFALGIVFARQIGLSVTEAALFMSTVVLGGLSFQVPIGILAPGDDAAAIEASHPA